MLAKRFSPGSPVWALGMLALVLATGMAALATTPGGSAIALWWPASGIAIGALTLSPRRWWLALVAGIVLASLAANLIGGHPPLVAFGYSVFNALEALVAAAVLRHGRGAAEIALRNHSDLARLLMAAALGALTLGIGASMVAALNGDNGWAVLRSATPSHFSSTVILLPVFLAHRVPPPSPHRSPSGLARHVELLVQTTLLGLAVLTCFGFTSLAVAALPLPLLTWSAFRFGHHVVAWQMLAVACAITLFSATGHGPFSVTPETSADPLLVASLTQAYLTAMVLLCLPVAVALTHSDQLYSVLKATQNLSEKTLSTTDCLILVSDLQGRLLRVNTAAERLFGRSEAALLATPVWHLAQLQDRESAKAMFEAPDGSGVPQHHESRVIAPDGEERRVLWRNGLVHDDERPTHLVMTGLDVTAELNAAGQTAHLLRADIDTAIIGIDRRGRITLVNSGAEKTLARSATSLAGTPFLHLLAAEDLAEWAQAHDVSQEFGPFLVHTLQSPPQDWRWLGHGTETMVSMTLSRIHDGTGNLIGYLCVASDVTEIRNRQKLLVDALETERDAVEQLRELDVAKDQFVTTVSHELRTPVATIVGYTEMLVHGEIGGLSPAQVRALGAINRNGERLVDLVDNLLALSGMTSTSFGWEGARVDMVEVVRASRKVISSSLQDRQLEVTYELPAESVAVGGHLDQLTLMLTNLVSNAVKFTEDGGHIQVSLTSDGDAALLSVTDDGLGIPEDEQENLFGRFWRSSTSRSRHIQGTGLGLATVQAVVAAHGGQIEIDSAHLRGTTVLVRLPLHQQRGRRVAAGRTEPVRRG